MHLGQRHIRCPTVIPKLFVSAPLIQGDALAGIRVPKEAKLNVDDFDDGRLFADGCEMQAIGPSSTIKEIARLVSLIAGNAVIRPVGQEKSIRSYGEYTRHIYFTCITDLIAWLAFTARVSRRDTLAGLGIAILVAVAEQMIIAVFRRGDALAIDAGIDGAGVAVLAFLI
jgi:hypothetical protein